MENALLVGLSRQTVLRRELDMVANNLANLGTTGFKSSGMVFREFLSPVARADGATRADRRLSYVEDKGEFTDFAKGAIAVTDNPLDVALDGDGFLVVQTDQGERFTRAGALKIDSQGRLVNTSGKPVLGTGGVFTFSQQETGVAIAADGTVSSSAGVRGKLRIVKFDNPQLLRREGGNLFASRVPPTEVTPGSVRVMQGSLERSNVEPIVETSRMIEITRAYQQLTALMAKTEDLRHDAISRLGDIPS